MRVAQQEEEDLFDLERPRSYSLPNKAYSLESNEYMFTIDRDFNQELKNYFYMKKELEKYRIRRMQQEQLLEDGQSLGQIEGGQILLANQHQRGPQIDENV